MMKPVTVRIIPLRQKYNHVTFIVVNYNHRHYKNPYHISLMYRVEVIPFVFKMIMYL